MKTHHVRNLLWVAALAAANVAVAAGGPGGQAGAAAGARGGAAVTLPGAAGGANAGGAASVGAGTANQPTDIPSPNSKALENANGQFIEDRKLGQDRAAERRSDQGNENERATQALEDKASANAKLPRKP